jgi:hypothetical protein
MINPDALPYVSFETRTCPRCNGTGQYSRNSYGQTTCYSCSGRKRVFTEKGQRLYNAFEAALSVPAETLVAGDVIPGHMVHRTGWKKVIEVKLAKPAIINGREVQYVSIVTEVSILQVPVGTPVRKGWSADHKAAVYAEITASA